MRRFIMIIISLMLVIGLSACGTDETDSLATHPYPENPDHDNEKNNPQDNMKLKITIGSTVFSSTLQDNAAITAFTKLLPMTIKMSDLNNNEKYYDLQNNLPTDPSNPGTIQNGELMLFGARTLVLFYKSFSTSYSYTRLGKIDDTAGLASALGSGNVTVTFESDIKNK